VAARVPYHPCSHWRMGIARTEPGLRPRVDRRSLGQRSPVFAVFDSLSSAPHLARSHITAAEIVWTALTGSRAVQNSTRCSNE
jgi:hypothetical protein